MLTEQLSRPWTGLIAKQGAGALTSPAEQTRLWQYLRGITGFRWGSSLWICEESANVLRRYCLEKPAAAAQKVKLPKGFVLPRRLEIMNSCNLHAGTHHLNWDGGRKLSCTNLIPQGRTGRMLTTVGLETGSSLTAESTGEFEVLSIDFSTGDLVLKLRLVQPELPVRKRSYTFYRIGITPLERLVTEATRVASDRLGHPLLETVTSETYWFRGKQFSSVQEAWRQETFGQVELVSQRPVDSFDRHLEIKSSHLDDQALELFDSEEDGRTVWRFQIETMTVHLKRFRGARASWRPLREHAKWSLASADEFDMATLRQKKYRVLHAVITPGVNLGKDTIRARIYECEKCGEAVALASFWLGESRLYIRQRNSMELVDVTAIRHDMLNSPWFKKDDDSVYFTANDFHLPGMVRTWDRCTLTFDRQALTAGFLREEKVDTREV